MTRSNLFRRYAPLLAVVVVQLLIIAVVPSKAPDDEGVALSAGGAGGGVPEGAVVDEQGNIIDPTTGQIIGGSGGGQAAAGGNAAAGGPRNAARATGPAAGGAPGVGAKGDTSHCRGGRQTDAIYYAPPCVPKGTGNPGATHMGVTGDKVNVVRFRPESDAAVDAILATQDLASSVQEEDAFMEAAEKFINARYELYGRKIDFNTYLSKGCDTLPPDPACFRGEARKAINEKKPFFMMWNTPIASAWFDEVSAQKVPNMGGWHYSDEFSNVRRPYHWDGPMSGTRIARHAAEYWCKRLAGKPAKYAGAPDTAVKTRRLGVITPSDPANKAVAAEFKQMVSGCGGGVVSEFYYDQDIDRANEQRKAGVARMRGDDVTTIICICDGIAPYFLVLTCDEDRYFPEHILAGTGGMDLDAVGRIYQKSTQMDQFFGMSALPLQEHWERNEAATVWRAAGNQGSPYKTAFGAWAYYNMVASAIQMAGPKLDPQALELGFFRIARGGDPAHELRSFGPNDYSAVDDMREVYWSSTAISTFDGRPGAWVGLNNSQRYKLGQWPAAEPVLPAARG